jgi:hypothetical protein
MNKVYVVSGCVDYGYDGNVEWNVCTTLSENKAKDITNRLNNASKYRKEFNARLIEFKEEYEKKHPTMSYLSEPKPTEEFRKAHLRCSNGNGTAKHKADYRRLQAEHIKAKETWRTEYIAECEAFRRALEEWRETNFHMPPELQDVIALCNEDEVPFEHHNSSDAEFSYQELNVIE